MIPDAEDTQPQGPGAGFIPYDARQQHSKTISNLRIKIINSHSQKDYLGWFDGLKELYICCFPFAQAKEVEQVKASIQELDRLLLLRHRIDQGMIHRKLWDLTELEMTAFKNQIMQVGQVEESEFNPDDFLRDE